jgi:hypothetical protein
MQVETTGLFFDGRCDIQTAWCRARDHGPLTAVKTPEGVQVNVCGACLEALTDAGLWQIPGTRPLPWPVCIPDPPPGTSVGCRIRSASDEPEAAGRTHPSGV